MKFLNNYRLLFFTVALVHLTLCHRLNGQVSSTNATEKYYWISIGGDLLRHQELPGLGLDIGLFYLSNSQVLSVRFRYLEMALPLCQLGPDEHQTVNLYEYNALYGLALKRSLFCITLSGGLGVLAPLEQSFRKEERYYSLAVPIELQILFTPLTFAAIGVNVFGNINSRTSFLGIAFTIQIGKFN